MQLESEQSEKLQDSFMDTERLIDFSSTTTLILAQTLLYLGYNFQREGFTPIIYKMQVYNYVQM